MLEGEPPDDLCIISEYDNGNWLGGKGGKGGILPEQWAGGSVKGTNDNDDSRCKVVMDGD